MKALALVLTLAAAPAAAGVGEALHDHILPGFSGFAEAAAGLADTARADCRPAAVKPAFHAAFDSWMRVADLHLGPSETGGLPVAFWPDDRGFTRRALAAMIAERNPATADPAAYAQVSIAARGFFALDMLLYEPDFAGYDSESYTCALVRAVATDLAAQAKALDAAWRDGFAAVLASAGDPGNATYLSRDEALRALYTQILGGLEFTADQRLGRPLGTFERPRPAMAEARRSGRSLQNAVLATEAAVALARALSDEPLPATEAAAEAMRRAATHIADPAFADVTDPQARLRVEVLQQAVRKVKAAIETEIGLRLGIAPGFNSQDGD